MSRRIVLVEGEETKLTGFKKSLPTEDHQQQPYVRRIVWFNVFKIALLHVLSLIGLLLVPFTDNATIYYTFFLILLSILGLQVGAHRLWSHRSFQANTAVRIFLCLCQTLTLQDDIYEWARNHRAHHKWSARGFFFSHCGWLMFRKHPLMLQRAATLDLTDLLADPVVTFQRKYYPILAAILWGLLPTILPVLLWNESAVVAFFICVLLRYLIVLHFSWLVNSWAHMYQWGTRPYNRGSIPVEASIRHLMLGEGFHNYHHAFPCDYSTSELGPLDVFNPPTVFINLLAKLGLAWDLKKPEVALIEKTIAKTGNSAVRYKKGRLLWEWTCGLLCATLPVSGLLFVKYTLRYVYLQYFDELPRLDVGVLWRDAINLVKVHFDVEMAF